MPDEVRFRVIDSPFFDVRKGDVGVLVGRKFHGTREEVLHIRFPSTSHLFRTSEVRVLAPREEKTHGTDG